MRAPYKGGSRTWCLVSTNTRLLRVDILGVSPERLFPRTENEVTDLQYHSKVILGGTRRSTQRWLLCLLSLPPLADRSDDQSALHPLH